MNSPCDQDIVIAAKLAGGKKLTPAEIARLQLRRERAHRAEWAPCAAPHVSDIIRWTEAVWAPGQAAPAAVILGRRTVTAQVVGRDAEKLSLAVMSQEWLNAPIPAPVLQPGERLRRKTSQLSAGGCERLSR